MKFKKCMCFNKFYLLDLKNHYRISESAELIAENLKRHILTRLMLCGSQFYNKNRGHKNIL